jgi:hypothetical protein
MAAWFGVADALTAEGESVPYAWEYRPGLGAGMLHPEEDYHAIAIVDAVERGDLDWDRVRHIGDVLARYARACERAGLSY